MITGNCYIYRDWGTKKLFERKATFVVDPRNNFHHRPVDGWILNIYILALIWIKKLLSLGSKELKYAYFLTKKCFSVIAKYLGVKWLSTTCYITSELTNTRGREVTQRISPPPLPLSIQPFMWSGGPVTHQQNKSYL